MGVFKLFVMIPFRIILFGIISSKHRFSFSKMIGRGRRKVGEKLTPNQRKIMEHIMETPYISAGELSELVGRSQRKIEENIAKLKEKGILRRVGPAKGGHWEILE